MKRNSKRRHSFVLVKAAQIQQPDVCKEPGKEEFVALFQSPKCPEKYAWFWALKIVRDWLRKNNIPFEKWNDYIIYPVHRFNCSQFNYPTNEQFYDHIHVADNDKEDDEATIKWYNEIKSKWKPTIK